MKRGSLPVRRRWWRWLLCLALMGLRSAWADTPPLGEGEPFMQYFSPRDYNGGTQCLCATQDARGVMYIGSLGVVLEYDGSTWRKIDVDSNWVMSMACEAETNAVFVGAQNNLGYLKLWPDGTRTFVSLLDQLPPDVRDVGTISGVYVTLDGVLFVGSRRVMRWRNGRFRTWDLTNTKSLESGWAGGFLYVFNPELGFLRMENDAFVPASDDPLFHRIVVRSVVAESDGSLLVGTSESGLFALRDRTVCPLEYECGDFLKRVGIRRILHLRDGSLAIATRDAGLLVFDSARRFRSRLDQKSVLHGKTIFNLFEDSEGGLWIGLQSGVARAEVSSPLSILRAGSEDDMSSAYSCARWFGTTILGNNTGLYRVIAADPVTAVSAHLELLPDIGNSATVMYSVENGLLILSNDKIALLDADAKLIPVANEINGAKDLCISQVQPGKAYVVDDNGCVHALRLDQSTQRWVMDKLVADLGVKGGEFWLSESARGDLWVGTTEHGLFRVQFAVDGQAQVTSFLNRPGPLQGNRALMICYGGGPLRVKAAHAVYGLDTSGQEPQILTEFGAQFCDGSFNIGEAMSYDKGSIWLTATDVNHPTGESLRGRATAGSKGHAPSFRPFPHSVEEMVGKCSVFHPVDVPPEPLTTLLLVGSTGNGVVKMDVTRWDTQPPPRPFATLIRRAVADDGDSTTQQPIQHDPLQYTRNSIHLGFAAATMALGAVPRFQTRLINFGTGAWSEFSNRNSVDYLNLPEGRYIFEVRACNADGQLGSVASVPFRILPPWQRSPWAYAAYTLALALAVFGLIRWRDRQSRLRNAALATLVDSRTSELRARQTDLLTNQHDLVRARDNAERANRAKSLFLANMSHELRTPLNAILGYSQVLLKQTGLTERSREQIHVIGQSGRHLLGMINEVLDLSKVEAGKLALSHQDYSLPQLLDEVYAAFRPRFAEVGLTFEQHREDGLPAVVHSDPGRLRQVLFNLLSNASKFTRQGGVRLEVGLTSPGRVRFAVTDTGIGIEADDLDDIFLAFHQTHEHGLGAQGTGLGLAISQRLVDLLGGKIQVESTPGRGSRFWFDLPLPEAVQPSSSIWRQPEPQGQERVTGYEGAPQRLLLVDDLNENRQVLRDFLQPLGFVVEDVVNGEDCLAACERRLPDALLLDLRLGTLDGFEVARTLRLRHAEAALGIIAISASVFESDRQQAIDAGCDDFLPKPFEEAQLLGTLGRVLKLRWVYASNNGSAAVSPPDSLANDGTDTPLLEETNALLELSLRGDIVGIRKRLEFLRSAGVTDGTAVLIRRLEPLVATYQMDGIHTLLMEVRAHAGN